MSLDDLFKKISTAATPVGKPEYLIVGLGNPGKEYEDTRHNAGFRAIDHIAEKCAVRINKAKYDSLCIEATLGGKCVLLMKPQTYMNSSGTAVSAAANFYKIPAETSLSSVTISPKSPASSASENREAQAVITDSKAS